MTDQNALTLNAPLVLASASPRRFEILSELGLIPAIQAANIDEDAVGRRGATGPESARLIAEAKAQSVVMREAAVIGADTIVELDGRVLGKPSDPADARRMLIELRSREHFVTTGVAVVYGGAMFADTETTIVSMRNYALAEIDAYLATGSPLDKAGAYGIQDEPFSPAAAIRGCYLNVVGLPVCLTTNLLEQAGLIHAAIGISCPSHDQARVSA
jgi:MAF protein